MLGIALFSHTSRAGGLLYRLIIKENYIIVDDLIGYVDIEIKGKFKRDEILKMVRTVLNSKNYNLIKNGALYEIHNNENLNDLI